MLQLYTGLRVVIDDDFEGSAWFRSFAEQVPKYLELFSVSSHTSLPPQSAKDAESYECYYSFLNDHVRNIPIFAKKNPWRCSFQIGFDSGRARLVVYEV